MSWKDVLKYDDEGNIVLREVVNYDNKEIVIWEDVVKYKKKKARRRKTQRSGKKQDACYYKVKSRYKTFPSAYASGALVQCRKVGAANWGNSKKK